MKMFMLFALLKMFKIVNESFNHDVVSEFGWKNVKCWSSDTNTFRYPQIPSPVLISVLN